MRHQFIERVGAEMALRHPADGLNVAQAAGARFDVRFEVVGGIEVAVMPLGLFLDLGFEEILRRPEPIGRQRAAHAGEQRFGPASRRASNKRGGDADVGEAFALAIVDGAHAVADFEADVPQKGQKALDVRLPVGGIALRQQHHDVDVGTRVQFAAPIAADRDQREVAGKFAGVAAPRRRASAISTSRARSRTRSSIGSSATKRSFEKLGAVIEDLAEDDGGELALFERCGDCREIGPVGDLIEKLAVRAQEAAAAAGVSTLAPRVSTS